jgi:hypothetical protein
MRANGENVIYRQCHYILCAVLRCGAAFSSKD